MSLFTKERIARFCERFSQKNLIFVMFFTFIPPKVWFAQKKSESHFSSFAHKKRWANSQPCLADRWSILYRTETRERINLIGSRATFVFFPCFPRKVFVEVSCQLERTCTEYANIHIIQKYYIYFVNITHNDTNYAIRHVLKHLISVSSKNFLPPILT